MSLQRAISLTDGLNPVEYPVVLVKLSAIPCQGGCCDAEVYVRPNTTDPRVLSQIFLQREYRFLNDLTFRPQAILDAGANIGLASILLAYLFPDATIFAIEPDPANSRILALNTAQFGNIVRLQTGLWPHKAGLKVVRKHCLDPKSCGSYGYRVQETTDRPEMQAVSVSSLLADHNLTGFDIVKVDVEGTEKLLFEQDVSWIDRSRLVSVEFHEDTAAGALERAKSVFREKGFGHTVSGEYHVWHGPHRTS